MHHLAPPDSMLLHITLQLTLFELEPQINLKCTLLNFVVKDVALISGNIDVLYITSGIIKLSTNLAH